ncbi:hypothetical protein EII25_03970 [Erysipelotrichaceae bacterium OH741_COT-311]|nr:hypothetical protein EII25_03970 [Erysipelotrichaceae bacterium OH741_COT-311]
MAVLNFHLKTNDNEFFSYESTINKNSISNLPHLIDIYLLSKIAQNEKSNVNYEIELAQNEDSFYNNTIKMSISDFYFFIDTLYLSINSIQYSNFARKIYDDYIKENNNENNSRKFFILLSEICRHNTINHNEDSDDNNENRNIDFTKKIYNEILQKDSKLIDDINNSKYPEYVHHAYNLSKYFNEFEFSLEEDNNIYVKLQIKYRNGEDINE